MAIYCLSPLAAVDFSHNDTNETDDGPKSIDNNDKSVRIIADDSNDSQDGKLDVAIKNQTKSRNANGIIPLELKVIALDYNQGEEGMLFIKHDNTSPIEVTCELNGNNYHSTQKIRLLANQPTMQLTLPKNLKPGMYTIKVYYEGDVIYKAAEASDSFEVKRTGKMDPELSVSAVSDKENTVTVDVNANSQLSGNVDVTLNGSDTVYPVNVENGHGQTTIGNVDFGNYTVTAKFGGDNNFNPANATTTVSVKQKLDPKITATAKNITVGQKAVVEFHADPNFSGTLNLRLNNDSAPNANIEDGYGSITFDDLAAGDYTVSYEYPGDAGQYKPCKGNVSFNVADKHDPRLNIMVDDITYGEDAIVQIYANETLSGNVNVTLNGSDTVHPVNVENGHGQAAIKNLNAGNYTATASYAGDNTFPPASKSTTFKVNKVSTTLSIDVDNVTGGDSAVAYIHSNKELCEDVKVKLDNSNPKTVRLIDGEGNITFNNLTHGNHTVKATFEGNNNFDKAENSKTFSVTKNDPKITATAKNITVGQKAVVEFHADPNFSGTLNLRLNNNPAPNANIENGYGSITFDDLATGDYTVSYEYPDDAGQYKPCKGNVSFNVADKNDPRLNIMVDDITYGEDAIVQIYANEALSGNVNVTLNGSDTVHQVNVENGHGQTAIKNLNAGNYTATASYAGDNTFHPGSKSTSFKVNKVSTALSVDVGNVTGGDSAVAYIHSNKELSEDVKVKLDSASPKTVRLIDGEGNVTFNNLAHGTHTVKATFEGNNNFDRAENSKTFSVSKNDPKLDVSAQSIDVGQDANVLITTDKSYTGKVDVQIDSNSSTVDIKDGKAEITLKDLKAGNHTVKAKINETSTFKSDEKTANFTVHKSNPDLDIKVEDVFAQENARAVVTTNKAFSGIVKVEVEGATYNVTVTNGEGSVELDALPYGPHEAKATFKETEMFVAAEKTTTFNVFKSNPNLDVGVSNINVGEDANVAVTTVTDFSGIVKVQVGNDSYNVTVSNGQGSLKIPGLAAGNYNVKATFEETAKYNASEKTARFTVSKYDPNLDVRVSNINAGEDANIMVTTVSDFSGIVKVQVANSNYNVNVANGQGSLKVSGLAGGNYNVKATFEETAKYNACEKTAGFTVNKVGSNLQVSVSSVRQSEKPVVTVTTDSKFSGNVNVKVDSSNYVVSVANGKGTKTISSLKKGKHTATATFAETPMFKSATKSVSFNIKDDTVKLVLKKTKIKKSSKKATLQATLKINGKAVKGKIVKFKFKGKTYKAKTNKKGIAKVVINKKVLKKLKVGKKVTYKAIYSPKTVKRTVKVFK